MTVWRENTRAREDLERQPEIVLPVSGEVINLTQPTHVAQALDQVREWKRRLDEIRAVLEDALRLESERKGTKTLHLDGITAVVSGGEKVEYDTEKLADLLLEEGLPASRLAELIAIQITYKVNQAVAKSVAAANPRYALALETCRTVAPAPWRVSTKKGAAG